MPSYKPAFSPFSGSPIRADGYSQIGGGHGGRSHGHIKGLPLGLPILHGRGTGLVREAMSHAKLMVGTESPFKPGCLARDNSGLLKPVLIVAVSVIKMFSVDDTSNESLEASTSSMFTGPIGRVKQTS